MENGNGNGHRRSFTFGEFNLDGPLERLRKGDTTVRLAKRPLSVLQFLIENRERVVSREELLGQFWDGHDVYDDALRKCVASIRKALGDTNGSPRFIEVRRGSGYRFIGDVAIANGRPVELVTESQPSREADKLLAFRPRNVFAAVCAVLLISIATLGFWAYRRQPQTVAARGLADAVAKRRSIAILPLKNLTGDPTQDYLSDGITESLINEISRIETLKVISRGSAFQFKDKDVSAKEVGERLGVETVLEGGFKQNGKDLRVEVRLVNASDGAVVWAGNFQQKKIADIFAIQDSITCQIVTELKVKLCGEVPPSERYTKNTEAYQLYLHGLYYRNRLTAEDLKKAVSYFDQALKVDPNYALAHEGLATTYAVMELNAVVPPGSVAPLAEASALRALELDDSLGGAYLALGAVRTMKNYDLAERERYYRQALVHNPNYRNAHLWLANNFTVQGKFEEAEAEILAAEQIDPLSYGVRLHLAELYWYWRKPDKMIEQANLMLVENPDDGGAHGLLARGYAQKGEYAKAFAELERIPDDTLIRIIVDASAGRLDEAQKLTADYAKSDEAKNSPFKVAVAYAEGNQNNAPIAWLEKAYDERQADLVSIKIDPAFDSMKDDPRYIDLLKRTNLSDR